MWKKALHVLWLVVAYVVVGLAENAMFGWVGDQLAGWLGIESPKLARVLEIAWDYGLPTATIVLFLATYHFLMPLVARATGSKATVVVPEQSARIDEWTNHGSYFVWAAACLWVEMKPETSINEKHPAYPSLQKIKGGIDDGLITSLDGKSSAQTRVKREQLLKLAFFHGDKPKFLFPDRQRNEDDDKTAALNRGYARAKLVHNPSRQAAISRLTQLRDDGVGMRNKVPLYLYPSDFNAWESKLIEWMEDVVETLKPVSDDDSKWFATLDAVPPARVPIPNIRLGTSEDRERFISIFGQHDYRLARLEKLLLKYGVGA